MKLRIWIYLAVSLYLVFINISIKIEALSSSKDGMFLVYEENEKIHLMNYNNEENIFISDGKMPSISSDGRFIVFSSSSYTDRNCPALLENKIERCVDIIIYDRLKDIYDNITSSFDNHSYSASISANNRFLAIETMASNIEGLNSSCQSYITNGKRTCSNIILYDLETNSIQIITNNTTFDSFDPKISKDGKVITFRSFQPFNKDIKKSCYHTFYETAYFCSTIYYSKNKKIDRVSSGKDDAYNPLVSEDGNFITYQSYDMEIEDYHHYYNSIYKYEINTKTKRLITNNPNRKVENVFLSETGSMIGVITEANNLIESESFDKKYLIYNENTKGYKLVASDCDDAISNSTGKSIFYLLEGKIYKDVYNDIIVHNKYETYFVKNGAYNLTKNVVVPLNCQFKIINIGDFSINKTGKYLITIEVYNDDTSLIYTYPVNVIEEDEPPIFSGQSDYRVELGNSSFSLSDNIEVYDIIDGPLSYKIVNDDDFDIYQEGKYTILLKASDSYYNTTYHTVNIEVYKKKENPFSSILGALVLFGALGCYILVALKKSHCS